MELIHKRGIGIKKEIQLNCEQSKKTGSTAAADSFSCGRERGEGGKGRRRVTDGNTNVERRSAADACH